MPFSSLRAFAPGAESGACIICNLEAAVVVHQAPLPIGGVFPEDRLRPYTPMAGPWGCPSRRCARGCPRHTALMSCCFCCESPQPAKK